jgi:hypothetical protein
MIIFFLWLYRANMAEPRLSCLLVLMYRQGHVACQSSFLEISVGLHLQPIVFVDGRYYNHWCYEERNHTIYNIHTFSIPLSEELCATI